MCSVGVGVCILMYSTGRLFKCAVQGCVFLCTPLEQFSAVHFNWAASASWFRRCKLYCNGYFHVSLHAALHWLPLHPADVAVIIFFGHKQMYFWSKADVLLLAIFWFEGNKCGIHQKRSVQKYIVAKEAQTCLKFFDSMTLCSELTGNLLTKKKALFRWKADATAVSSGASI